MWEGNKKRLQAHIQRRTSHMQVSIHPSEPPSGQQHPRALQSSCNGPALAGAQAALFGIHPLHRKICHALKKKFITPDRLTWFASGGVSQRGEVASVGVWLFGRHMSGGVSIAGG